jgi:uncharacterized protein YkwD
MTQQTARTVAGWGTRRSSPTSFRLSVVLGLLGLLGSSLAGCSAGSAGSAKPVEMGVTASVPGFTGSSTTGSATVSPDASGSASPSGSSVPSASTGASPSAATPTAPSTTPPPAVPRAAASGPSASRSAAAAASSAASAVGKAGSLLADQGKVAAGESPGGAAPLLLGPGTEALAESEVVRLVNVERQSAGCAPVTVNATLVELARAHSQDMAGAAGFRHNGSDGRTPFQRMMAAGYDYSVAAENIAAGQPNASSVMDAWLASPGHQANILDCRFTQLGVGVVNRPGSEYVVYWTQDFGTPM